MQTGWLLDTMRLHTARSIFVHVKLDAVCSGLHKVWAWLYIALGFHGVSRYPLLFGSYKLASCDHHCQVIASNQFGCWVC